MSKFYKFLNIPMGINEEYLSKIWTIDSLDKHSQKRIENPDDISNVFTKDVFELLEKLKCTVAVSEAFYTPPLSKIRWHTDVSGYSPVFDYVKINFVWTKSLHHEMQWGENKNKDFSPEIGYNKVGSPHLIYEDEDMNIVDRVLVDRPILVNVGRPHRVVNSSAHGRYCLCLIPKKNDKRISFEESLDLFSEYVAD